MYRFEPSYFDVNSRPPEEQDCERLYYEPCAGCGRSISDPLCQCGI